MEPVTNTARSPASAPPPDVAELLALIAGFALVVASAVLMVVTQWQPPFAATYAVLILSGIAGYTVSHLALRAWTRDPEDSGA